MDDRLREALIDLGLSLIKGLKILVVYILPSVLVAVLLSSELRVFLENDPRLVGLVPLINFIFVTLADMLKRQLPEDSKISKVL